MNTAGPSSDPSTLSPSPALDRLIGSLMDDLDEHVESFLIAAKKLDGYAAAFASGIVTEEEVRQKAYPSIEYLLRLIGGREVPKRLCNVPEAVGRSRAEQGFPLTSLMQGMRENFRILWAALLKRSGPNDREALLNSAFRVWEAVEQYSVGVVRSYQQTELEMARKRDDVRSAWFRRLLDHDGSHSATLQQAATVLNFDLGARFTVAVAASQGHRWMWNAAWELAAKGISCHRQDTQDGEVLVAQVSNASERSVVAALANVGCCVASAPTLADVPQAVRYAAVVAHNLPDHARASTLLSTSWLAVVASELGESLGRALCADILRGLRDVSPNEGRILRQTLVAYLVGDGTAADTARRLYCHRNTVLNRLRRFAELTGLEITRPDHAALTLLGLFYDGGLDAGERVQLQFGDRLLASERAAR